MKRVLGWVVNIILIWLVIIVVTLFLLPRFGGWRFDAILSGSMEPALSLGGVVVIKPVETADIGVGDIIAYGTQEMLITHRVVDVMSGLDELLFITQGDANEAPDMAPVPATNVVGKVVFDMPYLGYLAAFVKTRLGFLLTIFIPGLVIIGLELKNMWQAILRGGKTRVKPATIASVKLNKAPPVSDDHPEVVTVHRSALIDRIAIGIVIGAALVIISILAIAFLREVL
jgi:signal peptidase